MKRIDPLTKIMFSLALLSLPLLFSSCRQGVRMGKDTLWQIHSTEGPFGVQLTQKATGRVTDLAGVDGTSAFYYLTKEGPRYLQKQKAVITNNDSVYAVSYLTTDQREATVTITRGPADILHLALAVSPADGILKTGLTLRAHPGEQYYGLMERTVDGDQRKSWDPNTPGRLGLRGQKVTMLVRPTLGIYEPVYVSSEGYGLFVHGTHPGTYDLAATDTSFVRVEFDQDHLTCSVIPGPAMMDVVKHLPALTGKAFLPPSWAFRPLRWRDDHTNLRTYYDGTPHRAPYNSMVAEDILMAQAYDIPIGTYWVDRPWASGSRGYGNLRWDPERFPHAQDMIRWINGKGMKFMVWIAPWVCDSLLAEAGMKGYLMPALHDSTGRSYYPNPWLIDLNNEAAVHWWEKILQNRLIKMGVAGFKMDRSEEIISHIDTLVLANGTRIHDIRNDYPRRYIKAAHDALQEIRGHDFLPMPRAAYTGSQQYGVFWGGDIGAGEYGLRTALIAVQRCSFMNFPLWGSDIGGYWKHPLTHTNMARWLAFGAFTPIMEVGPLDNRAPWDMPYTPSYDTTLIAIYRTYSIIHDTLKSYSHTMARKASLEGVPIVRPLVLAFPEDKNVKGRWDEYMYGDNILVGIIWKNKQRSFDMYLPRGRWTDYWTGKEYTGGKTVRIDCPEYKIPIFLTGENRPALPDPNKLYEESLKRAGKKPDLTRLQAREFPKR